MDILSHMFEPKPFSKVMTIHTLDSEWKDSNTKIFEITVDICLKEPEFIDYRVK